MKRVLLALAFFSSVSYASCPELYAAGLKKHKQLTELCNIFFVISYDEHNSRPRFVSERLKQGTAVGKIERVNSFRQDSRVKNSPENADYVASGYDRGHLAPSANASTKDEQRATFVLTNMTPQVPTLNRRAWKVLEDNIRDIFYASTLDVFVVTIPIYSKDPPYMLGTVPIPTGYWKVVIANGETKTYYADNIFMAEVKEHKQIKWLELIR